MIKRTLWDAYDYWCNLDAVRMPNQVIGVTDFRDEGVLRQKMYLNSKYNRDPNYKPSNFVNSRMYKNSKFNAENAPIKSDDWEQKEQKEESEAAKIAREHGFDPEGICPVCGRTWKRHASPNSKDRKAGLKRDFIPCISLEELKRYQGKFVGNPDVEKFNSPRARTQRKSLESRMEDTKNNNPRGEHEGQGVNGIFQKGRKN